ncbi:Eco57I restriction-modification methylase domain-containing protein [Mesorhizobium australicum]|uniref:site-specific DNA-methyltransferase (adenine-specific) n=1 Tax=Mesorhizobium australicum TaxID=536018 RepID=A0A1X7MT32_9HYPH|nr:Eco57I restriction-modification methylase domain-containing protein [Mesorhizobium australicum]SMH27980.1 Methyltransferase domain-containing protein [Mesorhizobium australicum]
MIENVFQGSLFTSDFLTQSIVSNADWKSISDDDIDALAADLAAVFAAFPVGQSPNETRTEDDLIWPVLRRLGWDQAMRQQNLTVKGRDDVPDGLLFADAETKTQADRFPEEYKRYQFGLAIVESKRWRRPLDRQSGKRGEELAPSTQMLRYLRRVDDLTTGNLRWGILTNGGRWRLYHSGARSVSEQFFELDLAAVLGIAGHGDGLFALGDEQKRHALRVFALVFRREAFLPSATDPRTFHVRALEEGKFYEERVASDLSDLVFDKLYPLLARSIADKAPEAPLQDVREAALILLYRLLFILYAEDRDLLPVNDRRYDDYGLRDRVRLDVGDRKDKGDTFSNTAARYWSVLDDLCRAIDEGDTSIGLPPYNGGLFDPERTPLLRQVRLSDSVMAEMIDKLSFERTDDTRKYINYRDLSVQQLGSIYERLLEHEVVREGAVVDIRPNIFARKGSGSYYTPDDLVNLIIRETLEPLIEARLAAFRNKAEELASSDQDEGRKLGILRRLDPAERLLDLKICDPAMGSGHFLVSLVDYMADQVITAMAETETMVEWADYISPLADRIEGIRNTILGNAEERSWTVDPEQLDDRHIIRRMVLKRCVYGVDKNQMAVELAKVALWLHSFTVGAPLSFLDHHLRCGDSLFGSWVKTGIEKATAYGSPLLLHEPVKTALGSAASMQTIEGLPDAEIAEAHRSQEIFEGVQVMTAPLNAFLSLLHAIEWQDLKGKDNAKAIQGFFDGSFGDPFEIALGKREPQVRDDHGRRFLEILNVARELVAEERFLNWQVAFPGVWTDWENEGLSGGFDAIIGNPPWDRMKLQQVEWFAARKREIAFAQKAADRKRMIDELERNDDPLSGDFMKANERAEAATRMARSGGDYPLLSGGDVNIYSLFVERAMALVKRDGMVGLLTPSGIASDKTSSTFFKGVSTQGRLKALYDFENRRTRYNAAPFFPDVDSRFKFCVFVASPSPTVEAAMCAFFLQSVAELSDPEQRFPLTADDFARVNPNTGTAPIFRSRRDAKLTTAIYSSGKILSDRSGDQEVKAWQLKYSTMFHMTNDSRLFRTRQELEEQEGGWHKGGNRYGSPKGDWVPLYEGKMIQAFDHRAASVVVNPENQHRPAQPEPATLEQHRDPSWLPAPQFWVLEEKCKWPAERGWVLGFKEITAPTNVRTFIAALLPTVAFGNKVPLLLREDEAKEEWLLAANLNSIPFDYVTRQKVQGQTLNLFIVEQLPVITPERFHQTMFGSRSAAELLRDIVLELTYTAQDMAPFARDMGYTDDAGNVLPPFGWDEDRRLRLRAKLDAIFFHLYGITDRDDVRYVYSTFPIVERQERELYGGQYRSCDLCLAYLSALAAGSSETDMVA